MRRQHGENGQLNFSWTGPGYLQGRPRFSLEQLKVILSCQIWCKSKSLGCCCKGRTILTPLFTARSCQICKRLYPASCMMRRGNRIEALHIDQAARHLYTASCMGVLPLVLCFCTVSFRFNDLDQGLYAMQGSALGRAQGCP